MTDQLNEKDLWGYADLQGRGYGCRTKIWKMVKDGKFPQPIDDGNGNPKWFPKKVRDCRIIAKIEFLA